MSSVVDQMLQKYPVNTQEDAAQALREVMQEIALAGLNRGGFFGFFIHALFQEP